MNNPNLRPLVRLKQVSMQFGEKEVLRKIDLSVFPGDFLVLAGINGGGKTTLLRLLAGLLTPTSGTLEHLPNLRIGYLPQHREIDRHFPVTVQDVVLSGLHNCKHWWQRFQTIDHTRVTELLAEFNLSELAHRPISALSGGQWQRVLLARAFVSSPDLLLMDEPDTHLDVHNRNFLYERLTRLPSATATVLVSHDTTFLENHRVLRLGE